MPQQGRRALCSRDWHSHKGCSGDACTGIQNEGGTWPGECIMVRVHVAVSDLSHYKAMQSHRLQNWGRGKSERA